MNAHSKLRTTTTSPRSSCRSLYPSFSSFHLSRLFGLLLSLSLCFFLYLFASFFSYVPCFSRVFASPSSLPVHAHESHCTLMAFYVNIINLHERWTQSKRNINNRFPRDSEENMQFHREWILFSIAENELQCSFRCAPQQPNNCFFSALLFSLAIHTIQHGFWRNHFIFFFVFPSP